MSRLSLKRMTIIELGAAVDRFQEDDLPLYRPDHAYHRISYIRIERQMFELEDVKRQYEASNILFKL